MKTGLLANIISSRNIIIQKKNKPPIELKLANWQNIPLFESFSKDDEPGGLEAKQFLCQFVRQKIKFQVDKSTQEVVIWDDEQDQSKSINDQLLSFLASNNFNKQYSKTINDYTVPISRDLYNQITIKANQTYEFFFDEINSEGQFIAFEKNTNTLIVFQPQFVKIPVIGPQYKQFLDANLLDNQILSKTHTICISSLEYDSKKTLIFNGLFDKISVLLKDGVASLTDMAFLSIKDQDLLEQYDEYICQAQAENKGIWGKQTDFDSLITRIDSFLGIVREVESGIVLVIERIGEEQSQSKMIKIQLSKIQCPQGLERGAFEAREYLRKLVIGAEVDVFLEKEQGFLQCATVIISSSQLNLNQYLVSNGYAKIKEEFKGNFTDHKWIQTELDQKLAIQNQKGIHNKDLGIMRLKEIGVKETLELYQTQIKQNMNKEQYQCIVEKVLTGDRLLMRFISFSVIVKVKLFGIKCFQNDPNQPTLQENYRKSIDYNYKTLMNRNVQVDVIGLHDGCLLCKVYNQKKQDQSQLLLEEGLAYFKQETDNYDSIYEACQEKAKQEKRGIWEHEKVDVLLELHDNTSSMLKFIKQSSSQGDCKVPVHISQIKSANEFYVIYENNPIQKQIDDLVDSYDLPKLQKLKVIKQKTLCVAKSEQDGKLYRGKIVQKPANSQVDVEFIDYGLIEKLPTANLYQLPTDLAKYEAQCQLCTLAYVKVPFGNHKLAKAAKKEFEKLLDNGYVEAEFVQAGGNLTSIILTFENEPELDRSINALMIQSGFARINFNIPNNPFSDELFQDLEYDATDQQIGIWALNNQDRLSDDEGDSSDSYDY
ncbi:tudor domain protein (macronuclear) [Tetrahymena thermophila SB210]|uniref:Tudor domain protein n=1 Tax=Tetrahymena thermophila (strain SB210) TaxID=312017 RepID=Q24GI5_TETTS|nr:tudor domain protein [Tetrahymena thermophila SB210]EAS06886.2 tudor domain protein [Tetrahymena thermophila SB210]|eukprot:XP_001027128.2 tudor domain protein [Tetrahymena thermophila SB210]